MQAAVTHDELFKNYVGRLEWAVAEAANVEQLDRVRLEETFEGDEARVEEEVDAEGPLASNPYVLGAIREYWLACVALNESDSSNAIPPATFIFDWLKVTRPDLAQVIAQLPYWPIGQDDHGRWV